MQSDGIKPGQTVVVVDDLSVRPWFSKIYPLRLLLLLVNSLVITRRAKVQAVRYVYLTLDER